MVLKFFRKRKKPLYVFDSHSTDNNGNGSTFIEIYDKVWTDTERHKKEHLLAEDYENYCIENIYGVVKAKSIFEIGVFCGIKLYFEDEAAYSWFLLKE